jgi:hypothetical protein
MMLRKVPVRVGAVVRAREAYPYNLPERLADGVEVTVVSYNKATYNHVVRDPEGGEMDDQGASESRCRHRILTRRTLAAGGSSARPGGVRKERKPLLPRVRGIARNTIFFNSFIVSKLSP